MSSYKPNKWRSLLYTVRTAHQVHPSPGDKVRAAGKMAMGIGTFIKTEGNLRSHLNRSFRGGRIEALKPHFRSSTRVALSLWLPILHVFIVHRTIYVRRWAGNEQRGQQMRGDGLPIPD